MSASARAPSLAALTEPDSFNEIWCKTTWLSDELELRRDHQALRSLMKCLACATTVTEMAQALQVASALFKLHAAIQAQLLGMRQLRASIEHLLVLIEQLESTDPDDPLFIARAAHLKQQLELITEVEEDFYEALGHANSAAEIDGDVLTTRTRLLREADALHRSALMSAPVTQRLC